MAARRCSRCATNWPGDYGYIKCPYCDDPTAYMSNADPITSDEATRILKRLKFDDYYAKRGERDAEVDFSYLDEIAALEAIPVAGEPIPVPPLPPERWGSEAHLLGGSGIV